MHIDDEEYFLDLVKLYLDKINPEIELIEYNSPVEALELLKYQQPDVIVCDYQMPEIDGLELLKKIRSSSITTPFIFLTGKGREEVVIEALNNGADFYLEKGKNTKSTIAELDYLVQRAHEKHQTKELLHQNEVLFRSAFENAFIGVIIASAQKGHILRANNAFRKILGYNEEEVMGKTFIDFTPNNEVSVGQIKTHEMLSGTIETTILEKSYVHKSGHLVDCQVMSSLVRNSHGNPAFFITYIMDITEKKNRDELIVQQKVMLENNLQAMVQGINNLTTKIGGLLDQRELEELQPALSEVEILLENSKTLADLPSRMLKAGKHAKSAKPLLLERVVRNIMRTVIPPEIKCFLINKPTFPLLIGDEVKATYIFKELIDNAVIHGKPKIITVNCEFEPDGAYIFVENDGEIIKPEIRSKLFSRSSECKETGLMTVKKLVKDFGWTISLDQIEKTRFKIFIPISYYGKRD
jgi:PAS domain S-box-containing protein